MFRIQAPHYHQKILNKEDFLWFAKIWSSKRLNQQTRAKIHLERNKTLSSQGSQPYFWKSRSCISFNSCLTLSAATDKAYCFFSPVSLATTAICLPFNSRGPSSTRSGTPCYNNKSSKRTFMVDNFHHCSSAKHFPNKHTTCKPTDKQAQMSSQTLSSQWLNFQPGE